MIATPGPATYSAVGDFVETAQVNVFKGSHDAFPQQTITLAQALETIRNGTYEAEIAQLRNILATQGKTQYNAKKVHLDAFTLCGTFAPRRGIAHLVQHNGIVNGDIDGVSDIVAARQALLGDPWLVYLFVTSSGMGLRLGVRVEVVADDLAYKHVWQVVAEAYERNYGLTWDKTGKDISRLSFVSFDPDLYTNAEAHPYMVPRYQSPATPPRPAPLPATAPLSGDRRESYAGQAIQTAINMIDSSIAPTATTPGNRHATRLKAAILLGGYVAGGVLTMQEAYTALHDAVARNTDNLPRSMKTIEDGLRHGAAQPITIAQLEAERETWLMQHSARLIVSKPSMYGAQPYIWGSPPGRNGSTPHPPDDTASAPTWGSVEPAPAFAQQTDTVEEALVNNLVMPQEITLVVAPRGEGKSVWVLFLAITAAKGGTFRGQTFQPMRVLLVDRDNSNREIRNRLRHFGVDGADNFKILTRTMGAPGLLDHHAWESFPVKEYDLVIIDSLASATEGISEKEGKLTQQVLATLKDVARQGPAILCLDNTVKSGEYHHGRNELAAAVDIFYEVRDVTGWTPSDPECWWENLPDAGEQAWTSRLTRRNKHTIRRLAFMPTKFRSAAEPEPFIIEVNFITDPWSLREVTTEVVEAATADARVEQANQKDLLRIAAHAMATHLRGLAEGLCVKTMEAELFLRQQGLNRRQARNLLDAEDGTLWQRRTISPPGRGLGFFAMPHVDTHTAAASITETGDPQEILPIDTSHLAVSLSGDGEQTTNGKEHEYLLP